DAFGGGAIGALREEATGASGGDFVLDNTTRVLDNEVRDFGSLRDHLSRPSHRHTTRVSPPPLTAFRIMMSPSWTGRTAGDVPANAGTAERVPGLLEPREIVDDHAGKTHKEKNVEDLRLLMSPRRSPAEKQNASKSVKGPSVGFRARKVRHSLKAQNFLQFGLRGIAGQRALVEDTGNDLEVVVSMEEMKEDIEDQKEE
ncbi:unnamed protein product, partial [Ascophyllum nodosum]